MSTKHPDQISMHRWRDNAETAGEMWAKNWDVLAICGHCQLHMHVNLVVTIAVKGPAFRLWNKKARCKRMLCPGWMAFHGRPPGASQHRPLSAPDRLPDTPRKPQGHVWRAFDEAHAEHQAKAKPPSSSG